MPAEKLKTGRMTRKCPFCTEFIRYEAVKCRFCGEFLYDDRPYGVAEQRSGLNVEDHDEDEPGDEDLLYWGRPSVFALSRSLFIGLCLLGLAVALWYCPAGALVENIPSLDLSEAQIVNIEGKLRNAGVILAGFVLLVLLFRVIAIKSTSYEVKPDHIEWARGIFSQKIDNLYMFHIVDLKLHRSVLDCLLGIGTVTIATRDKSNPEFEFVKVRQCRYLYDVIKKSSLEADKKRGVIHLE